MPAPADPAERGRKLYELSCTRCHGADPGEPGPPDMNGLYMPEFPLERMSRQQARDLFTWLRGLPASQSASSPTCPSF